MVICPDCGKEVKEAKFLYLPRISLNAGATAYNLDYPTIIPESSEGL